MIGDACAVDLADRLAGVVSDLAANKHRLTVAVDGPDAAGKTTLARQIASRLTAPVIPVSVDSFHRPRQDRYRRGELSAEGYYRDSFDYQAITGQCLTPFRNGAPTIRTAAYDFRSNTSRANEAAVPATAILMFDGVFLLRPELASFWDLAIYLRVSPDTTLRRALTRDVGLFGSAAEICRRYLRRYLPGQALYQADAAPEESAHIIIGNNDPWNPVIIGWQPAIRPSTPDATTAQQARQSRHPEGCHPVPWCPGQASARASQAAPAVDDAAAARSASARTSRATCGHTTSGR